MGFRRSGIARQPGKPVVSGSSQAWSLLLQTIAQYRRGGTVLRELQRARADYSSLAARCRDRRMPPAASPIEASARFAGLRLWPGWADTARGRISVSFGWCTSYCDLIRWLPTSKSAFRTGDGAPNALDGVLLSPPNGFQLVVSTLRLPLNPVSAATIGLPSRSALPPRQYFRHRNWYCGCTQPQKKKSLHCEEGQDNETPTIRASLCLCSHQVHSQRCIRLIE